MANHTLANLQDDEIFSLLITDEEYCPMNYTDFKEMLDAVEGSWKSATTTSKGITLEKLGVYLLDCVIPFKVTHDEKTPINQLDGLIEVLPFKGHNPFLSEIGRFFLGECKNENESVGITHVSKIQNNLSKHRMNLAVLFSRKNIAGAGKFEGAQGEVISAFRANGERILCIPFDDLKTICTAKINFLSYLKEKDKELRLFQVKNNTFETEIRKHRELLKEGTIEQEDFDQIKKSLMNKYFN